MNAIATDELADFDEAEEPTATATSAPEGP